ncbi:hypothetical protein MNBD_GAMMA03-1822 [hydrothermal vent metagenome]|uniref:TIGR02646 family protein n=1 Tax=hydrothermal vent metagenome TaxID=652676 RepID=A0A3B0W153_9ZZZZ
MKKLDRSLATSPECLGTLCHTADSWSSSKLKKSEIWSEFNKFQDKFCVYCESRACQNDGSGHIEHFFNKKTYKSKTFVWNNLFGCCESRNHCGHYKDQILQGGHPRAYDSNLLLKPDEDDPEDYIQFLIGGKVEPKEGLVSPDLDKAIETIKALCLNHSSLISARKNQITLFSQQMLSLNGLEDDIFKIELDLIERGAENEPHRTAIKQVLF